jgi:hypothetical protein
MNIPHPEAKQDLVVARNLEIQFFWKFGNLEIWKIEKSDDI